MHGDYWTDPGKPELEAMLTPVNAALIVHASPDALVCLLQLSLSGPENAYVFRRHSR